MNLERMRFRVEIVGEVDGIDIIDSKVASLLYLIDKYGSILSSSKALGIPYSRAWDLISKIERLLNVPVIERKRGGKRGGGTRLTEYGRHILESYLKAYKNYLKKDFEPNTKSIYIPELIYMGSNDPIVEHICKILRDRYSIDVEIEWLGSGLGLASISLGEADICGIHLLDPQTNMYNIPYIEKYWIENRVLIVRGYLRDIGFVSREPLTYDEIIEGILSGKLKLACRQRGTGTRTLLEYILEKECYKRGIALSRIKGRIRGFETEYKTHLDVVKAIAKGEADVGIAIKWAAEQYRLNYMHITWENFDFVISIDSINKKAVREFLNMLKSNEIKRLIHEFEGYRIPQDMGNPIRLIK